MASRPAKVELIANDIREYFRVNPCAGDTVEGITNWWIAKQRFRNPKPMVQKALDYLERNGEVQKRVFNGQEIYVQDTVTKAVS